MKNIKYPAWEDFDYIYSGKQREAFEVLCRNLFRLRYNLPEALGYFKNHAGNESDIITQNDEVIGFNAKYFDHSIDKAQIIHSIQKAKENNPAQTKIIIYTNREFGNPQRGKGKTAVQQIIEEKAKKLSLKLEWMYGQNILDAVIKSELLYNVFFNPDDCTRYLIDDITKRNERILQSIKIDIKGNHFNRDDENDSVINSLQGKKSVILSGCSGIGKSAVFKSVFDKIIHTYYIMILRGDDFDVTNIDDLFPFTHKHNFTSFVDFHRSVKNKLLVVDAVENVFNYKKRSILKDFLYELEAEGWQFIFTIRDSSINGFTKWIDTNLPSLSYDTIEIKPISEKTLQNYCNENNIELDKIANIKALLQIPFYLDCFVELGKNGTSDSEHNFKEAIWSYKVRGIGIYSESEQIARTQTINTVVRYCEENHTAYISEEGLNAIAVSQLVSDGVLVYIRESLLSFSHDIYRDWAYENVIYHDYFSLSSDKFILRHANSQAAMFAFKNIVSELANKKDQHLESIFADVFDGKYPKEWENQILASILKSDYVDDFISTYRVHLWDNNCQWLTRLIQILITHCQHITTYVEFKGKTYPVFLPEGKGWNTVVLELQQTDNEWYLSNFPLLLELFKICAHYPKLNMCIAKQLWRFFEINAQSDSGIYMDSKIEKMYYSLVCAYSIVLTEQLTTMIDSAPMMDEYSKDRSYFDLIMYMATTTDSISRRYLAISIPDSYIKLIDWFWTAPEKKYRSNVDMSSETAFGINTYNADYQFFPCSGLQTPVKELLDINPDKTLEFIINFFNRCFDIFIQNKYWIDNGVFYIEFLTPDGRHNKVIASDNLWRMYRDTCSLAMPDLLKSILMALENYLLDQCDKKQQNTVRVYLEKILNKSNNCAPIAVVASIVVAYPYSFIDIAMYLFSSSGFFVLDNYRKTLDLTGSYLNFKYMGHNDMYQEREHANNMRHRKESLEDLCLKFQIVNEQNKNPKVLKQITKLHDILDEFYDMYSAWSPEEKAQSPFGFLLARLDLRKMARRTITLQDGRKGVEFLPQLSEAQLNFSQRQQNEATDILKYISLRAWAKYEHDIDERSKAYPYHSSPLDAFVLMKELCDKIEKGEHVFLGDPQTIPVVAGILLSKFVDHLNYVQIEFCDNILKKAFADIELMTDSLCNFEVCLSALPSLMQRTKTKSQLKNIVNFLLPYLQNTTLRSMNTRCCDVIGKVAHSHDFQIKHEELITLLINDLGLTPDTKTVANENIADALLCILPYATNCSKWLDLTQSCITVFAEYLKRNMGKHYPQVDLDLVNNFGRYIGASDIECIPMFLNLLKDSLDGSYTAYQFLIGIMSQTLSNNRYAEWRLVCDVLLDKIANLENNIFPCKLTSLIMLNPECIPSEFADNWYKFNKSDMERIRIFVGKVPHREPILIHLLSVANGIGANYHTQFLPLLADVIHEGMKLDHKNEVVLQLEKFMDRVSQVNQNEDHKTYNSAVKIINFMINHGSIMASKILKQRSPRHFG